MSAHIVARPKGTKSKDLINIRRFEDTGKRTFGWFVQLSRMNVRHKRFFSDGLHEGKAKALRAAKAYRDAVKLVTDSDQKTWRRTQRRSNNTSEIPGVGRYVARNNNGQPTKPFWQAFWNDEFGVRRSRKFSVSVNGEKRARDLAIAERRRQLARLALLLKTD